MALLTGKNILVTGVLTDGSIAFHIAKLAQEEGANVVLTGFGRGLSLTTRIAARLPKPAPVIELDVTNQEQLAALAGEVRKYLPHLDGVVHSIGFAPQAALGGNFLYTEWEDVAIAIHTSTFSFKSLAMAVRELFPSTGASIVGLTFDASVAWPKYDWMGVAKAGLESCSRYLARDLGKENVPFPLKLGLFGPRTCRPWRNRPALRLVPQNHGRDHPRGWWSTCNRGVTCDFTLSRAEGYPSSIKRSLSLPPHRLRLIGQEDARHLVGLLLCDLFPLQKLVF